MIQMMKINCFGKKFSVIYYKGKTNPFRLYEHDYKLNKYGQLVKTRKQIEKYANFESCLLHLAGRYIPEFRREE